MNKIIKFTSEILINLEFLFLRFVDYVDTLTLENTLIRSFSQCRPRQFRLINDSGPSMSHTFIDGLGVCRTLSKLLYYLY